MRVINAPSCHRYALSYYENIQDLAEMTQIWLHKIIYNCCILFDFFFLLSKLLFVIVAYILKQQIETKNTLCNKCKMKNLIVHDPPTQSPHEAQTKPTWSPNKAHMTYIVLRYRSSSLCHNFLIFHVKACQTTIAISCNQIYQYKFNTIILLRL